MNNFICIGNLLSKRSTDIFSDDILPSKHNNIRFCKNKCQACEYWLFTISLTFSRNPKKDTKQPLKNVVSSVPSVDSTIKRPQIFSLENNKIVPLDNTKVPQKIPVYDNNTLTGTNGHENKLDMHTKLVVMIDNKSRSSGPMYNHMTDTHQWPNVSTGANVRTKYTPNQYEYTSTNRDDDKYTSRNASDDKYTSRNASDDKFTSTNRDEYKLVDYRSEYSDIPLILCKNGDGCIYYRSGRCRFYHPM